MMYNTQYENPGPQDQGGQEENRPATWPQGLALPFRCPPVCPLLALVGFPLSELEPLFLLIALPFGAWIVLEVAPED